MRGKGREDNLKISLALENDFHNEFTYNCPLCKAMAIVLDSPSTNRAYRVEREVQEERPGTGAAH